MPSHYVVILPAYNEEQYLAQVLQSVAKLGLELVVVDDGSSDRTVRIAKKYTPHVLHHRVNLGKGAALKTGCEYAFHQLHADGVILMDSDAQHDPSELPLFVKKLAAGNDVVFGVRDLKHNMPWFRVLGNKMTSQLTALFFGVYIPDILCGYKALTRKGYKAVKWDASDYGVEMEIAARVSRRRLPFALQPIHTIYLNLQRGMSILDTFAIIRQFVIWKFTL